MCGKDVKNSFQQLKLTGSPPLAREGLKCFTCKSELGRITPACAGRTIIITNYFFSNKDHPRVCGKDGRYSRLNSSNVGSAPHVREELIKS